MSEPIREYADSRGERIRVDSSQSVIRGVKILGVKSKNGRVYSSEAMRQAIALYENAKVNVNHGKGESGSPRDYQDRIGTVRDVVYREGEGLFADFYFNPKHPVAEQLVWDATHEPEHVGFSHNVQAQLERNEGQSIVRGIMAVHSVDLVADPATTHGLFESCTKVQYSQQCASHGSSLRGDSFADASLYETSCGVQQDEMKRMLRHLGLRQLESMRPDLVAEVRQSAERQVSELTEQLERLQVEKSVRSRRDLVERLLREQGLISVDGDMSTESETVSQYFIQQLMSAPAEECVRQLVEQRMDLIRDLQGIASQWGGRQALHRVGQPLAREQSVGTAREVADANGFVKAVTR